MFIKISILRIKWSLLVPFNQECFVQSLVEIGPMVLDQKISKFCQSNFAILL